MAKIKYGKNGQILQLASHLKGLTARHILNAVAEFESLNGDIESYDDSRLYDLVINGNKYPPKAIFGLAASQVLGQAVLSSHFSAGDEHPCFKLLRQLGFLIQPKTERPTAEDGLILHRRYNRKSVCRIFSPKTNFTPGSGVWGLQGIIPNSPCVDDFVLFVTLGHYDGNDYEDSVTADGYLMWKSQNRHDPESPIIKSLVTHNENDNNVYLFLRTSEKDDYCYLGPLAFHSWDSRSSNPVHISWKILNWPLTQATQKEIGLELQAPTVATYKPLQPIDEHASLVECKKPVGQTQRTKSHTGTQGTVNWDKRDQRNREVGLRGEELVLAYEKSQLLQAGRPDLAKKVEHVALTNSAAGYDLLSFDAHGHRKYIEVKTTSDSHNTPFYISRNEVERSLELGKDYWIYRVFGFNPTNTQTRFYKIQGAADQVLNLQPEVYKAMALSNE
ncbi:DUF3427 domain-containing protein [Ferrimonas sp. YFM]|uniref:DUF3427 domain-containing protein n=1 Tax=Ferrimonas sp. YFM TaxID=3028878 RepID=UPI002572A3D4|nr:DUF3427 domain-containing protein [Ferrimonas sp. YFM]BDY03352.1 hypothetical protein F0521_03930 [Ferrimonas sp. YFM]